MTELTRLTIAEALDLLDRGEITAVALTEAHIRAIEAARPLHCFITETADRALDMARASDTRRAQGEARPLDGIPLAIKDLFCTDGVPTTAGSHILEGFTPTYESTVTANLWRDGAVMLGKANLDEFAMGSANVTSYYGPAKNPWGPLDGRDLVPGGSSGGSAGAVAAAMNSAQAGRIIADSEEPVRDAHAEFRPQAYQKAVDLLQAKQEAFSPSAGRASQQGSPSHHASDDQRAG